MGMMTTLAQCYSDNLSQETKKGKAERKAQGFYRGRPDRGGEAAARAGRLLRAGHERTWVERVNPRSH